ncbi:hypothetical protein CPS_0691 [Colwellia psychrerythraea 34H]|uniref:Uncharacterized protein n=1 Tax=Colwellia psychrerythraea (strain 34H / ATCC BAA-681) TaxID=167879 RepID=Q488S3_COLP3|nr:hypothetical protein CPS_0691 [Colwellia psychrerythraea 34H]
MIFLNDLFKWSKYSITLLLSIPIASYCSIKHLVLENLSSLKFEPLINLIGTNISDN